MIPNTTGTIMCPYCNEVTTVDYAKANKHARTTHKCDHCRNTFEIVGAIGSEVWRREPHPNDT